MPEKRAKRKLSGILSADAVGYSRLMQEDETSTIQNLEESKKLMSDFIKEFKGRVVDAPGDNLLAEFSSVVDATECAVKIQQELKSRNEKLPDDRKMEFRIAINLGDVIEEEDRIYGDGINIAARLEGLAEEGGICISGTAYDQVKNKLPFRYEFKGEQKVKNIKELVRVYNILMKAEVAEQKINKGIELPDKPSIAVLPFINMSGDSEQEFFSDGISEEIITGLSKVPQMFVIARNSSFIYKGKPVKIQVVSEELCVRYVLEGSVRKAANRVRVTAQLIDATTGHHLWADRYDRDLDDIFALQDEITMKILTALQVELTEGQQARVYGKGTSNFEAYIKFLQARKFFTLSGINKEAIALSRQTAEEAIKLDKEYPAPHVLLAWTHWVEARFGLAESADESYKMAYSIAQKAVSMDDSIPGVHALLGGVYLSRRQHELAIDEGLKAIDLGPNDAEVHALMAHILRFSGRFEEAVAMIKKALRLQPHYPTWYITELSMCYYYVGKYEKAIEFAEKYRKLTLSRGEDEFLWPYNLMLAINYIRLGREQQARKAAAGLLQLFPSFSLEWDHKYSYYKNPSDLEKQHEDLRAAGLE